MELVIMQLVYKIFKMKIFLFIFCFLITKNSFAQVIPVGTIKKTNKLNSVSITDLGAAPLNNWPRFQLKGSIQINGSSSAIDENGFVFKEGYYGTLPNLQNADRIVSVSSGLSDFIATIGDFPQPSSKFFGTIYSVRAYIKNSFGQISYSDEYIIQVNYNYCELSPCLNGAGCLNSSLGPICLCTIDFCDNCCSAQASDPYCPGGGEVSCNVNYNIAASTLTQKFKYQNSIIKTNSEVSIWGTDKITINSQSFVTKLK